MGFLRDEIAMKIVVVDLWTDDNRGDCALQLGLIRMIRDALPQASIEGIFRFGHNEIDEASEEVSITLAALDSYCGGPRRTLYGRRNSISRSIGLKKIHSFFSFLEVAVYVVLYMAKLRWFLPSKVSRSLGAISEADVVIWKGKNFRHYGGLSGLQRQATLVCNGFIATLLNSNVHCINASIWKIPQSTERRILRAALTRCCSVGVRDLESLDNAKKSLELDEIFFAFDLSLYLLKDIATNSALAEWQANQENEPYAALTITSWGNVDDRTQYVAQILSALRYLNEVGIKRIVIVPQVVRWAEDNSEVKARIVTEAKSAGIAIEDIAAGLDIAQLLKLYARAAILIGTRMHSCVFALVAKTPIVAVAYDAGPKWAIIEQLSGSKVFLYGEAGLAQATASALATDEGHLQRLRENALAAGERAGENVRFLP
jgi:colanic acid/amylovoran biosynthesis protein